MTAKTLAVSVVIGAALTAGYKKTFETATDKTTRLGAALKKAEGGAASIAQFKKLKKSVGETAAAMQAAKLKTAALAKEVKATDKPSKQLIRDFEQSKRKSARLKEAYRQQSEQLHRLRSGLRGAGVDTIKLGQAEKTLGRQVDAARKKLEALQRSQALHARNKSIRGDLRGKALGAVGAAYGAGRLIGQSVGLEQAQVRLSTVANTKELGKSLALSRRHALDFARKNLTSETEVLNIEYALNSAGLDASAARMGSEVVAKVAKVTNGSAERVGEVIATAFNNLGDKLHGSTAEKLNRIGELLTKTQFKFQIRDFSQLGESMKIGATVMSQYNIALDQGVTLLGALNSAGLQGEQAGTSLAATMRSMSKASKKFGFELAHNEKGQLDVVATLKNLSESIGGFKNMTTETSNALQQTFGDEGIRGVIALGKQVDKLAAAQRDVADGSKGLIDKSYALFLKSSGGQLTLFNNNLRILGETITGTLLPAVNAILAPVTATFRWLSVMSEKFPVVGQALGGLASGFVAVTTAAIGWRYIGTLVSDVGLIMGRWGRAALSIGTRILPIVATGIRAVGVAMAANPIGVTIAGIALAAGLIYEYWTPITGFFKSLWGGITSIFSRVSAWIGKTITHPIDVLKNTLGSAWNSLFGASSKPIVAKAAPAALAATMAVTTPAFAQPKPLIQPVTQRLTQAQAAQPKPDALQNIRAASAAPAPKSTVVHQDNRASYVMHVNMDGGDPGQVKQAVSDAMAEKEREHAARTRGALFDYQGG